MKLDKYIFDKSRGGMVYMPYITMGDPSMKKTVEYSLSMIDAGADLLELGIPFSDPTADGPVIQAAMDRALQPESSEDFAKGFSRDLSRDFSIGFSMEKVFETCYQIHTKRPHIPLIILSYLNPVINGFSFLKGKFSKESYESAVNKKIEFFLRKCCDSGIRGLVIPDLPFDQIESEMLRSFFPKYKTAQILMATPYTNPKRLSELCQKAQGWIYYVSSYGVTGMREELPLEMKEKVQDIKKKSGLPVLAGFGFHEPKQIKGLHGILDGVIVGSKNQSIIANKGTVAKDSVQDFVQDSVKDSVKEELAELTLSFVRACHQAEK